jgi:hypothetical protein
MRAPVNGWRQDAPVGTPSLPCVRSLRGVARTRAMNAATRASAGVPATSVRHERVLRRRGS